MADEIEKLEKLDKAFQPAVKKLEKTVPLLGPLPRDAVALMGETGNWLVQYQHGFIPEEQYRSGEGASYRQAFQPLYERLPEIKTPTRVAVLYMEDGMSPRSQVPLHGKTVAATGAAVWEALTGEKHLSGLLYNRSPYEDSVGPTRKPLLEPGLPAHLTRDRTFPLFQAWLKKSTYHVVSTSTGHLNNSIRSKADRLRAEKELNDVFGENTVFIQSAGNYMRGGLHFRHSAYSNHPDTILIGASQSMPDAQPGRPRSQHMESYSSYGPDICCETQPLSALYLENLPPFPAKYVQTQGTSFSAPQAAVIVEALLSRFAQSPENPQAVLTKHDISLALRQTAQTLHVREYISLTSQENDKHLLDLIPVGDHVVSDAAGNGSIDIPAAWQQLERMEKAVREGGAKMMPRQELAAPLAQVAPTPDAEGFYRYTVEMKGNQHVDSILLDTHVASRLPFAPPGNMVLQSPQGERVPLFASVHPYDLYRMAKTSVFHGKKIEGTWTLLSNEPLRDVDISFRRSMDPQHVGVTHAPDVTERSRKLYRLADFKTIKPTDLDQRMLKPEADGIPPIAKYDFSATRFPESYLDLRLLQLAADPASKSQALALAASGHPAFKSREAELITAIAKGDTNQLLALIAPDDTAKMALVDYAFNNRDSRETFTAIAKLGLSKQRTADGTPFINRLVQHANNNISWDSANQMATLSAVIAVMQQQSESIIQADKNNKTPLDYVLNPAIWQTLQDAVTKEKMLAQVQQEEKAFTHAIEEFVTLAKPQKLQPHWSLTNIGDMLRSLEVKLDKNHQRPVPLQNTGTITKPELKSVR